MNLSIKRRQFLGSTLNMFIVFMMLLMSIIFLNSFSRGIHILSNFQQSIDHSYTLRYSSNDLSHVLDKMLLKSELGMDIEPLYGKYAYSKLSLEHDLEEIAAHLGTGEAEILEAFKDLKILASNFLNLSAQIVDFIKTGDLDSAQDLANYSAYKAKEDFLIASETLIKIQSSRPLTSFAEVLKQTQRQKRNLVLLALLALFSGVIASFLISRSITGPLDRLKKDVEIIGSGTLTHAVFSHSDDEIGNLAKSFDTMRLELKSITDSLESRIQQATQELQTALKHTIESEQEIKLINTKLEGYSYTISHDLKEPIRSIRTFSEFLLEDYTDQFDEEGLDYFNRIIRASSKMALMIDDLLILSRIGRKDVNYSRVDTDQLVHDVEDTLRQAIEEKQAKIIRQSLPAIICQPVWMKTIFQNLISNSLKYCREEKPVIEISSSEEDDNYIFFVKDNGQGIDKSQWTRVFELFRKAHQDRNIEGSGAGLAIVASILDQHGGSIHIHESEPGQGTTIRFTVSKLLNEQSEERI